MKKMYLVRQIFLSDDYGSRRIDEEALFDKKECAQQFINHLTDKHASKSVLTLFRNTITEMPVNEPDNWESIVEHIFSIDGRLLKTILPQDYSNLPVEALFFSEKFKIGDLVTVKSKLECQYSFSVKGTYAVVGECTGQHNQNDQHYIIYYINHEDFIIHEHVIESVLDDCVEVPKGYDFLNLLSNYFLNKKIDIKDKENIVRALSQKIKINPPRKPR